MKGLITLTTDFGLRDPWVGAIKGVILSINPASRIIDISHQITHQNVAEGAFVLAEAAAYYPSGTIHVAVVDPGVGSQRRLILVETESFVFVGPDNGIFTPFIESPSLKKVVHLTEEKFFAEEVSSTFHGRDVFAPIAAHLSLGVEVETFGPECSDPVTLTELRPRISEHSVLGEVVYVDNFGNLITNIKGADIAALEEEGEVDIIIKGHVIEGLSESYSSSPGSLSALINSSGRVEVAAFSDDASGLLIAAEGTPVEVRRRPDRARLEDSN